MTIQWNAQLLRYTMFLHPSQEASIDPGAWWNSTTGEFPEEINFQPRLQKYRATSTYAGGALTLQLEGGRIDWVLVVTGENSAESQEAIAIPSIGHYPDVRNIFLELIHKWLTSIDNIPLAQRIAFGATLIINEENRIDGYRRLDTLLHDVKLDPEGSRDFSYAINRPRIINNIEGVPSISINRLSKWGVISPIRQSMQLLPILKFPNFESSQAYATCLELDINTDSAFEGPFDSQQALNLLNIFVELSNEISEGGDVK